MKQSALILAVALGLPGLLFLGIYIGTMKAYGFFAPAIEERVIRDANYELMRVGARKYELALDVGTVIVIPRKR